jgi:16S rRNA (guanine527-N7)-methyltransferase
LLKWQHVHRLVGSADPEWIVEELLLDSLLFLHVLPVGFARLADLGSGAGIPGIPIKIVRRDAEVVLIESRQRRASFLSTVVRELGLAGVLVCNARVEEAPGELAGRFDVVVVRSAGDLGQLMPAARRLLESRGIVVASGPPVPKPLRMGRWVSVAGACPGTVRHFAIATASGPALEGEMGM